MANSCNLWFDESFALVIHGFVFPGVSLWSCGGKFGIRKIFKSWCACVGVFSPLLLGSAMVAMFVTPLWCSEELFVVKSSEVLIMMVSKLAQAGAAALDTKSTASPDVSWFPLQAP